MYERIMSCKLSQYGIRELLVIFTFFQISWWFVAFWMYWYANDTLEAAAANLGVGGRPYYGLIFVAGMFAAVSFLIYTLDNNRNEIVRAVRNFAFFFCLAGAVMLTCYSALTPAPARQSFATGYLHFGIALIVISVLAAGFIAWRYQGTGKFEDEATQ